MRKQLVIGVSMLALTGLGGVSENHVSTNLQGENSQYTHFVRTSLNQTYESLSRAGFDLSLPNRPTFQTAGVHFIVGDQGTDFGNDDAKNNDFSDPTGETCKRLGYTVTSCASGLFNSACPYNDKIYDRCCDATYKYTASQCSSPRKLSSDKCGGKYKCYCDTRTYPYASCNSPQIKGSSCSDDTGTRYATCTCPGSVATPYGCQTYYASPCNNVCQKAYADNCRNRTAVQTPYGCETYFSDCKSKCQKAYADNCRNRTAVSTPYGCQQAFGDCQSKCEIAYADNCRNRTAVISSCPSNASCSYFSDCSSKIQSWSCNSGYNKSGNTCVKACSNTCPAGYLSRTCKSSEVLVGTSKTDCGSSGSTCYKCRTKTCSDGGYYTSMQSGKACTLISYSGLSCYTCQSVTTYYMNIRLGGNNTRCEFEIMKSNGSNMTTDSGYITSNSGITKPFNSNESVTIYFRNCTYGGSAYCPRFGTVNGVQQNCNFHGCSTNSSAVQGYMGVCSFSGSLEYSVDIFIQM